MTKLAVMAVFDSPDRVSRVIGYLQHAGFESTDVSVVFPRNDTDGSGAADACTKAAEGGMGAGGAFGGTLGLLLGIVAMTIPGLGLVAIAGPIVGALVGAAAGAAVGGLAGTLISLGVPAAEAERYEGSVRGGSVLVAVHAADPASAGRARDILSQSGGLDMIVTREDWPRTGVTG
jgi:hypothetical protein